MAGPYITADNLLDAIAQGLKKAKSALQPYWTDIATRCVSRGWMDLRNVLLAKGYTSDQLDQWDDRAAYNLDQSLFWAYTEGGGPSNEEQANYKRFDRATQFTKQDPAAIAISIGGAMVSPGAVGAGQAVATGQVTQYLDGVNAGTTFGLKSQRRDGLNQYGDTITEWD